MFCIEMLQSRFILNFFFFYSTWIIMFIGCTLKCMFCQTNVMFCTNVMLKWMTLLYIWSWKSTRMHRVLILATPIYWAWFFVSTIAWGSIFILTWYVFIMTDYLTFKVRKRTITNHEIITIERFIKPTHFWEMFEYLGRLKNFLPIFVKTSPLFRMGFFGAAHGWGQSKMPPPPLHKICHTYPKMMKLGTVITNPKKVQKIYEWCETPLEFCWRQHFSLEISKFCYI